MTKSRLDKNKKNKAQHAPPKQQHRSTSNAWSFLPILLTFVLVLVYMQWMIHQGPTIESVLDPTASSSIGRQLRLFQQTTQSHGNKLDGQQGRLYQQDYWDSIFQQEADVSTDEYKNHHDANPIIFYHIFIPDSTSYDVNNATTSRTAQIIRDQLQQIRNSYLAKGRNTEQQPPGQQRTTRILFNTVTNHTADSPPNYHASWIDAITSWCRQEEYTHLQCRHLRNFDIGTFEDATLHMMHGYCSTAHHPSASVVYIHNKGSLHSRNGTNDAWRQSLTAAVTSAECSQHMMEASETEDDSSNCDACGLLFQTVPAIHFPGNMFHAKCSYIRQLLPIPEFLQKSQHIQSTLKTLAKENLLQRGVYTKQEEWVLGEGRYLWEQWIGSYVHLRACDVSPTNDISVWKESPASSNESRPVFSWSVAPRKPLLTNHWKIRPMLNKQMLLHDSQQRRRDINLLPGLLVRYALMFRQWPQSESWVWGHFPDGSKWKSALLESTSDGSSTEASVQTLIRHLKSPSVPIILSQAASEHHHQPHTNWSIFYNMYIPTDVEDSSFAIDIIQQHWRQIQESIVQWSGNSTVPIHFKTIGKMPPRGTLSEFCQSTPDRDKSKSNAQQKANLECKHEGHHDSAFEEETLTAMWKHCQQNPNASVIYMHSKGTYHNYEGGENEWWRYHLTRVVTGQQCWEQVDNGQCQVCGLQYYPIHASYFPGNFFAASCSYVQHLKSPQNYQKMLANNILPELKLRKQSQTLFTNLWNPNEDSIVGDGRFSMEHWIASHPRMTKPCDASETANVRYWLRPHSDDKLNVSLAPRLDIWAPYHKIQVGKRKNVVMPLKSKRIREYFLLAGNLLKSILIYNELPPWDSWVWTWFPDGAEWKEAAKVHGLEVVDFMTHKYSEMVQAEEDGGQTAAVR